MSVEKLLDKVYLIDTHGLGFEKCIGAYLIKDEKTALIDVGYASSLNNLLAGVKTAGADPSKIDYIILTHIHLDHSGAAGKLTKISKGSLVKAHPRAIKHLIDPSKLISSVREVYGAKAERFGEVLPIDSDMVEEVADEEEIKLGSLTLRLHLTPGHAPHHISVQLIEEKALFCGDALSMKIPSFKHDIPQTPPPSYIHEQAVQSIKRFMGLEVEVVLRPHYGSMRIYPGFFDDQVALLNWWKNFIYELVVEKSEKSFEGVLRYYLKEVGEENVPPFIEENLKISFDGMVRYLKRAGIISSD
ncbi:MAG: hypothetical protein DRN68_04700 [Thaumarchaeota archaeon]|nr:MAG: hypothetical protein DRN68_04700 [Nitrososphaerota archaeon]